MSEPPTTGDSDVLVRNPKRMPYRRIALVTAGVGMVLAAALSLNMRRLERERLEERFGRLVQNDMAIVHAVVQRHEGALRSLRLRFAGPDRVSREEFRATAAEIIAQNSSFSVLEWVPRVAAADRAKVEAEARADGLPRFVFSERDPTGRLVAAPSRPEHWPVLMAEPMTGNEVVLGYDLRVGPTATDIEVARDGGDTRVSRPLQLLQDEQQRRSVIAIVPVYAAKAPVKTVEQRRAAFRGVVQGIARIEDVLDEVYQDQAELTYDVALFDQSPGLTGERRLNFRPAKASAPASAPSQPFAGEFTANQPASIGQRNWVFSFRASPEWISRNTSLAPALTLAIGVLGTVALCGILLGVDRQTRTIEARVQRRTSALRDANDRLEREAAERRQVEAALRQSERSLVEAQRIARLGRWESDPSTGALKWSDATFRLFGVNPADFKPNVDAFYRLVHAEDRNYVRQQVQAVLQLGIPYQIVHRIVLPDGSVRHVQENAELVQDGPDRRPRLVGTVLDITERRDVEEALAKERNLLRTLLDAIPDLIVVKDREGRYTLVNLANARALGVAHPTLTEGKTDADFQPAEQAARQSADDREVLEQGRAIINREEQITHGTPGWFLTNKIPLRDDRGQVTGLIGISRDITERRRMLEELEQEHAFLRTLIDTLPDFVYVKDLQGRFVLTNKGNLRLLGLKSLDEAIGKTVFDVFPPDIAALYEEDDRRVLTGEVIINRAHPARFPDGRLGSILTTKVPIRDRDGRITAVFGVSRDITEHTRLQQEREEMDRRINQTQKLESLGALAGGVAHDFNNILTVILNNATLAQQHRGDEAQFRECLGQIEHAAARAGHLCNQMLAYSGRGQFVIQPVRLGDLVEDTLPLLRTTISRRAELEIETEPGDAVAQADVTQIRQIILNLVINASDALADQPGHIRITTGVMHADAGYLASASLVPEVQSGDFVFLEVSDSGCGMAPETVTRIFEPFFTTKFTGRGLGLAAVLGIVRGHRGAIKVTTAPGAGTTFRLLLPAVFGLAPRPLRRKPEPTPSGTATGRILVVDDEEFIRSVVGRSLERVGFSTVPAACGEDAVQALASDPEGFAAVLLDLTMPRMDGQQTFEALRKISPRLPVLLMSGFSELEATARFAGQGLAGFIQKPFEMAQLITQLRAVIQGAGKQG